MTAMIASPATGLLQKWLNYHRKKKKWDTLYPISSNYSMY